VTFIYVENDDHDDDDDDDDDDDRVDCASLQEFMIEICVQL
jgi:hypothetical protein